MIDSASSKTYVDHPVGHLAHAEPSRVAQLLLLLLAGVRVVRMAVQPVFQEIRHGLRELAALARWALDEARGRGQLGRLMLLRRTRGRAGEGDRYRHGDGGRRGGGCEPADSPCVRAVGRRRRGIGIRRRGIHAVITMLLMMRRECPLLLGLDDAGR